MPADDAESLLITAVRRGSQQAWQELIARYEGRLLAFIDSRLRNRAASEDIVQDTFLGFLVSLPNYDAATPLETYLFSIAAHKLTDVLRRKGRRPTIPLVVEDSQGRWSEPVGSDRRASSLAQSRERRVAEEQVVAECLRSLIAVVEGKRRARAAAMHRALIRAGLAEQIGRRTPGHLRAGRRQSQALRGDQAQGSGEKSPPAEFRPANFGIT